ncbi:MAG: hypothetical protein ACYCTL_06225 [Acidimicrobiales bacterium]
MKEDLTAALSQLAWRQACRGSDLPDDRARLDQITGARPPVDKEHY